MMNQLLSLFGIHRAGMVLGVASNVIRAFEQEFAQDHDAKCAAITALIDVLQQHKDAPAPAHPAAPVAAK
jgi:hypothetical protein